VLRPAAVASNIPARALAPSPSGRGLG
jgi:hypothetical protein